ncbi:IPT/TIG domain-containing protein [bacterium]|nr:IPT/TIG domain-containing protein [bacterium]
MRPSTALLLPLAALTGCQLAGQGSFPVAETDPLTGRVAFTTRRVQADLTEVGTKATVSLIDTANNRTEAATVTDEHGAFKLTFTRTFRPVTGTLYYLEAVKGLGNNAPGNNAARVRTIARYQSGWTTLTNALPNQAIVLDASTTALSIGAALRHGNPAPFDFSSIIGKIAVGSPSTYVEVPALPTSDYTSLLNLVEQSLVDNLDPVGGIRLMLPNTWLQVLRGLTISGLVPASGSIGATVSITGSGFNTLPGANLVAFNGVIAVVTAATPTNLTATVPAGATTGVVTVQNGDRSATGPVFTLTGMLPGAIGTDGSGVLPGGISDGN